MNGLKELFIQKRRKLDKVQFDALVKKFVAALEGKTGLDLGKAIVEAAGGERFDRDTVQFLDSIVEQSMVELDVIELRLLRQLAERAKAPQPGDWDDATARMIWDTVILAEDASNHPLTLPYVRSLLDQADALRREAEVLVLPAAIGFASPAQITDSWQRLQASYRFIDDCQQRIRDARSVLDRARSTLPAYVPYLEAGGQAEREARWLQTAQTTADLDHLLQNQGPASEAPGDATERLKQLNNELADLTRKLESHLTELLMPFQPAALRELERQAGANKPAPSVARDVEALLTTPFLAAAERAKLWSLGLALDRRLSELSPRDSAATADTSRTQAVRELVRRRTERAFALLALAAKSPSADRDGTSANAGSEASAASRSASTDLSSDLGTLARLWSEMAAVARSVHEKIVDPRKRAEHPDDDDRPGWIVDAFELDLDANPIRDARDRDDLAGWTWLAGCYRHRNRDLHDQFEPLNFYERAALDCPGGDKSANELALELTVPESASSLSLSGKNTRATAAFELLLKGAADAGAQKVPWKVLEPADTRLRVAGRPPAEIELAPQSPRPANFLVEWVDSADRNAPPPPKGLIVQARLPNQRPYHLLVPVTVVSESTLPRLLLRTDPSQSSDVPFGRLPLRTIPGRQKFFVIIKNPSEVAREVIVEVVAETRVIAATPAKPALPAPPKSETTVPSFGAPVLKETDPLPEAPAGLKLRLRNAASGELFDEKPLEPAIATALEYLEVRGQPRFIPARLGEPNRLEITLRPLRQMTGPPCRVRLTIPSDTELFPAFVELPRTSLLENAIEPGGKDLTLYAQGIKLNPGAKTEAGLFYLTIDGLERCLWYKTQFVAQGEAQVATPFQDPRVRFEAKPVVKPDQSAKLAVAFKVDNVPPDAKLEFHVSQNKSGQFVDDLYFDVTAKQQHIGFDPTGPGGALQFEASQGDWTKEVVTAGLRGRKKLQADLIDRDNRKPLASWSTYQVLDDAPPENAVVTAPRRVEKGTARLPVKATVTPPESGIKDVGFIVGSKEDFAKPELAGKAIPGKPKGADRSEWEGTLTLPKDATGTIVVTARFTSGVGLTALDSAEIEIHEPAPSPEEAAAAKPAPKRPGAIVGKVTENDVAQPGLEVYLIDPKAKDADTFVKKKTKTKPDGTYEFPDVEPGLYQVRSMKQATNRRDSKPVTVPSGETVKQDLDLILQ